MNPRDLIKKLFTESLESPKFKDRITTDEDCHNLGESVKGFLKSDVWVKVLEPFVEDTAMTAMSNLINSGLSLKNEEKNEIILSVSLALSIRNEFTRVITEGNLAWARLKEKEKSGHPRKRT